MKSKDLHLVMSQEGTADCLEGGSGGHKGPVAPADPTVPRDLGLVDT